MSIYIGSPGWWDYETLNSLVVVEAYVANVEKQLRLGLRWFAEEYEGLIEEAERHRDLNVLDDLNSYDWDIEDIYNNVFPKLHRASVLLTLCAWYESRLNELCFRYQQETGSALSVQDLRGAGIHRAREYLSKVVGLDLTSKASKQAWNIVRDIYAVRNIVAHADGRIRAHADETMRIVERSESLQMAPGMHIVFNEGYLRSVTNTFRRLTMSIGKASRELRSGK